MHFVGFSSNYSMFLFVFYILHSTLEDLCQPELCGDQCFQIVWSDLVDLGPTRTINHD
jgi:hypothetical protein